MFIMTQLIVIIIYFINMLYLYVIKYLLHKNIILSVHIILHNYKYSEPLLVEK